MNVSSKKLTGFGGFAFWCMLLLFLLIGGWALADTAIEIQADEWTWDANGRCSFQGSILPDRDLKDAVLTVSVETRLEDSGTVQFTSMNGKKLKIRKRSAQAETDFTAGIPVPFEGEWFLPSDTEDGIAWARITLQAADKEGNTLAVKQTEIGNRDQDLVLQGSSPAEKTEKMTLLFAVAAGIVWILAIARNLILRKKNDRK